MIPSKAIEILSDSANRGTTTFNQDFKDALNFAITCINLYSTIEKYILIHGHFRLK